MWTNFIEENVFNEDVNEIASKRPIRMNYALTLLLVPFSTFHTQIFAANSSDLRKL